MFLRKEIFTLSSQKNQSKEFMDYQRQSILGVDVNPINFDQTLNMCSRFIRDKEPVYICLAPAHSIMDCYYDNNIRDIFNKSRLTVPDGMAVVWILKLRGNRSVNRVYGPDLLLSMCELSAREGWKHYFYGSTESISRDLQKYLLSKYPELEIAGAHSPPHTKGKIVEDQGIIDKINKAAPDIIWVGLGSPKQDQWMADNRDRLEAPLLIGVGAAFDFISGNIKQAPYWVQQSGFEWLFRLLNEPGRLWKRYSQYPLFALLVGLEFLGINLRDK